MNPALLIPLAGELAVVLIVALAQFARVRDRELDVQARLSQAEMEHRGRLAELEAELGRLRAKV